MGAEVTYLIRRKNEICTSWTRDAAYSTIERRGLMLRKIAAGMCF
jgi:hypothetical protein